ncbi:MAG: AAA family ATPase [Muribaculaceae bacterium]|nr:AAA family ATPase [Muribaculaceae bacterium]
METNSTKRNPLSERMGETEHISSAVDRLLNLKAAPRHPKGGKVKLKELPRFNINGLRSLKNTQEAASKKPEADTPKTDADTPKPEVNTTKEVDTPKPEVCPPVEPVSTPARAVSTLLAETPVSKPRQCGITRMMSGDEWVRYADVSIDQKQLCGPLWYEGEICILFADTNVGKSLLAVQIADMIASGGSTPTLIPELRPETLAQPVIYADFELSIAQFARRYSCPAEEGSPKKLYYDFGQRFHRVELFYDITQTDAEEFATKKFADQIISDLENRIVETGAQVIIIDNITFMASGTETAADAMPLMKKLVALKKRHGMSILLLAHTPKRCMSNPITRNDLQGSKMLINFADSAFALGESCRDSSLRYIKQIKQRNTEVVYGRESVLECSIGQVCPNFVGFTSHGTGLEDNNLPKPSVEAGGRRSGEGTQYSRDEQKARAKEMLAAGTHPDTVAKELGIHRATLYRWRNEVSDNPGN